MASWVSVLGYCTQLPKPVIHISLRHKRVPLQGLQYSKIAVLADGRQNQTSLNPVPCSGILKIREGQESRSLNQEA
jgi:hypothetical protein